MAKAIQLLKGNSSKWIHETFPRLRRFEWQEGYAAFSYSHTDIDQVYNYIQNQEEHHQKISFKTEYLDLLKEFNVPIDEKYIFQDLI